MNRPGFLDGPYRGALDQFSFYSLSAAKDNLLLWSHYATGHTGFAVEFDAGLMDRPFFWNAQAITYASKRPRVVFAGVGDKPENDRLMQACILTKAQDWEYEEEYRLVWENHHGMIQFEEQLLIGIILGSRMSDEDRRRILTLAASRTSKPRIYQASISSSDFKVDVEPVPRTVLAKLVGPEIAAIFPE